MSELRKDPDLRALAEAAVYATLPVLPLVGSSNSGYRLSPIISTKTVATPEEWADAARAIADLHAAIEASS